jgi:hypothetical protein
LRGLFASGDDDIAFAVVEAHLATDPDISLDWVVDSLARRNLSATCQLVGVAKAVDRLRQSKEVRDLIPDEVLERLKRVIQTLAGHKCKCKYDGLLNQMERDAWLRAEAQLVPEIFGHEEPAMDGTGTGRG